MTLCAEPFVSRNTATTPRVCGGTPRWQGGHEDVELDDSSPKHCPLHLGDVFANRSMRLTGDIGTGLSKRRSEPGKTAQQVGSDQNLAISDLTSTDADRAGLNEARDLSGDLRNDAL